MRRTWAEIDLDAAKYNFQALKSKTAAGKLLAVVKANAYGHGSVRMSRLYEELGASYLAVSNIEEALEIRHSGVRTPILVLGFVPPECASKAVENDITLSVYSLEIAKAFSKVVNGIGKTLKIHLKFDTGMGRIGFLPKPYGKSSLYEALVAARLDGLFVEGAFSHLAVADGGDDDAGRQYTRTQARLFLDALKYLKDRGVEIPISHISNTAATLDYPELALDMVRLGISLYGLKPSENVKNLPKLKPVMTLKSIVSHIKNVPSGTALSYGCTFLTKKETTVATVPIGYADGFFRSSANGGVLLTVSHSPVPILGRVCMDQLMLDVTDIDGVNFEDEVCIFGKGAYESADSYAIKNGTIGYEAVCAVGHRVPRIYKIADEVEEYLDYLK